MAASSKLMITEAERRFPMRVRVAIPPTGFGDRLNWVHAWLDNNCGADDWEIAPAGMHGLIDDAIAVYFRDAMMAAAFAARWYTPVTLDVSDGSRASATTSPPRASPRARTRRPDRGEAQFSG
jgi:hypothetical protein